MKIIKTNKYSKIAGQAEKELKVETKKKKNKGDNYLSEGIVVLNKI